MISEPEVEKNNQAKSSPSRGGHVVCTRSTQILSTIVKSTRFTYYRLD